MSSNLTLSATTKNGLKFNVLRAGRAKSFELPPNINRLSHERNHEIAKFRNFCYSELVASRQRTHKIAPITLNGIKIVQVIIDAHYEEKHQAYMSDALILNLVKELDGRRELPETKTDRYSYFATLIEFEEKKYRLVWLLENHAIYIGVVNAYRDGRRS